MNYRNVPGIDGLSCTENGEFRYKDRPKKPVYCFTVNKKKATVRILISINKKMHYWQAAKLIAKTWNPRYSEDTYIIYKDGDCHNIALSNLKLVDRKRYFEYMRRNSGFYGDNLEQRKKKLQLVIDEAQMTLHYFKTKDLSPVHKHVTEYLYPTLIHYCIQTLHMGRLPSATIVPDCLARMYEVIINGMCLYNYERYCKKLLLNYKKTGTFGLTGKVPKAIEIEVEQLNLDCLCERYNVTHSKK